VIAANVNQSRPRPKPICITPGCEREAIARGLCGACVVAARRLIREKKATWEQLETAGLVEPATRGPGKFGLFMAAFIEHEHRRDSKRTRRAGK